MSADPERLGRYQLERVLGKGAMGVVYEALDPRLHRKVAIKTILKSHLDEATAREYSKRFRREALAVARLNHPNIVQVFDFGEEGEVAFLVMEFIRGRELKSFFDAREKFPVKEAVRIMCELLSALDYAHESGIIHRDVKPVNIMLDVNGHTKLTDFGVARVSDPDRSAADRTAAGTVVGTPAYMSPEQVQGKQVDRRSDIFSAGVVLYQLLTSTRPFTGSGAWTIAKKVVGEDPPIPSTVNVSLLPEFDKVVLKALAKDPDKRFASAAEFAAALERIVDGNSVAQIATTAVSGSESVDDIIDITLDGMPEIATATGGAEASADGGPGEAAREAELEFWRSVKDSDDPDDFALYVEQFPRGVYVHLAERKIARLRTAGAGSASAARERGTSQAKRDSEEVKRHISEESAYHAAENAARAEDQRARHAAEEVARAEDQRARHAAEEARAAAARRGRDDQERREPKSKRPVDTREDAPLQMSISAGEPELAPLIEPARQASGSAVPQKRKPAHGERREPTLKADASLTRLSPEASQTRLSPEISQTGPSPDASQTKLSPREAAAQARREAAERARREIEARERQTIQEQARLEAEQKQARLRGEPVPKPQEETQSRITGVFDAFASMFRSSPSPETTRPAAGADPDQLFERASALETQGRIAQAVKLYRQAAQFGHGPSASRLGAIYQDGWGDVARDHEESLRYYELARRAGESVPTAKGR